MDIGNIKWEKMNDYGKKDYDHFIFNRFFVKALD